MFKMKRLWHPLAWSQNMITPLEILTVLIFVHMVYFHFLPIYPPAGWTQTCEWFFSGAIAGSIGIIWITRAIYVGSGVAATVTTLGGVIITFGGAAMIGVAVAYAIEEIRKGSEYLM